MLIVHGLHIGVATIIELGRSDQPRLEFWEGDLVILSRVPDFVLGRVIYATAIDFRVICRKEGIGKPNRIKYKAAEI